MCIGKNLEIRFVSHCSGENMIYCDTMSLYCDFLKLSLTVLNSNLNTPTQFYY